MGYTHLTLIERGKLEAFLELNFSTRAIADKLGQHHSTIAREIKRNRLKSFDYKALQADSGVLIDAQIYQGLAS